MQSRPRAPTTTLAKTLLQDNEHILEPHQLTSPHLTSSGFIDAQPVLLLFRLLLLSDNLTLTATHPVRGTFHHHGIITARPNPMDRQ